jgi:Outer membrane protein beta-barrel domain
MKREKNNILYCISIVAVLALGALKTEAQNFELRLRYEPEFSALLNKNDADAGPSLGYASHFTYFNFGVGAVYNFNHSIGLAADILFSREGQNFRGNFAATTPDPATYGSVVSTQVYLNHLGILGDYIAKSELNFIKLPVMFSFMSANTKPFFFTAEAGPQVDFLYNVAQEINHIDRGYPNSNITPFGLYKPVTIDGVIAIGAGYNLTSHLVVSAQLRFDYGFEDIENKDVMVSYYGAAPVLFYSPDRQATHNTTAGLLIGAGFKI